MESAVRRATQVRDDHFGPVALGVQIDGDLGWADRRGLVVVPRQMQNRSRLIVGTSGTGKTTDIEREGFRAARDGRKFFLIDGKGTDPGFVERALAGYLWGNPHARVALWPELAMDGWRGSAAAIHNRLVAMLGWSEPYYQDVASLLLRLALNAPGEDGPIRSSTQLMARMDPELLVRLYEHDPDRRREAESLVGRDQARAVKGAIGRFANFFAATSGGFDAGPQGWSFEDVDFAYLRAPYLAGRQDADACMRLLLEDFAHYATLRKPRRGEDATLVFDEFSAIAGGREAAIQLVERVRDAGCALYLSAQSADGLGDEAQQRRLVGACSGGLLLHAVPDPDTLLRAAGVVKVVEQTWRLDPQGPTGNSSARIGERPRIEPTAVQQAREGEAWYIARGRFEHLMVARTAISDGYRARAHAMVALARSWRPTEALPGAPHLGRGVTGRPGGPARPPGAPGHRTAPRCRRRWAGAAHAAARAIRAGAGRASAAPGRGRRRPRRRPGGHRHPGPPGPGPRPGRGRAAGGCRGPLAQAPPAPPRLPGRTPLDRSSVATVAPASSSTGRTGAAAMTGQVRRAQRRRTTRSTTISTATSAAIQTSTQIHSSPGMARLLPSGSVAKRDGGTPARRWLRA
jgi:hypothetical protein